MIEQEFKVEDFENYSRFVRLVKMSLIGILTISFACLVIMILFFPAFFIIVVILMMVMSISLVCGLYLKMFPMRGGLHTLRPDTTGLP